MMRSTLSTFTKHTMGRVLRALPPQERFPDQQRHLFRTPLKTPQPRGQKAPPPGARNMQPNRPEAGHEIRLVVALAIVPPYKARSLPRDEFKLIYFKFYKSQIPVIEQAIATAALMLGSDKSRGYCLEMICADFLAGANLDDSNPDTLLHSVSRFFKFLPGEQRQAFLQHEMERAAS
jgi:hypothetical protein